MKEYRVHVRAKKLASAFLIGLVTSLIFVATSGESYAQSTRSFQMGIWPGTCPGTQCPVVGTDTDIQAFGDRDTQPPGRSIVLTLDVKPATTTPLFDRDYDWSRIVAVEVDEPYNSAHTNNFPCNQDAIATIDTIMAQRASELKVIAPHVRFWVNFTPTDITAMGAGTNGCTADLNKPYIDVVSLDDYGVPFGWDNNVQPDTGVMVYYDWLINNPATPQQQLALIPGTFVGQEGILGGYYPYPNYVNSQGCDLPLGPRGVTGSYDRCRVWIVFGWAAGDFPGYVGELDPNAGGIRNIWQPEVNVPRRADLAHQLTPAKLFQPVLDQFVLNN
jgi:hypothetical protein